MKSLTVENVLSVANNKKTKLKVENESNLSRVPYFYLPCGWSNPKVFVTHRYNYSHLRVGEWLFATLVNKQIILHACNVIYSVFIFLKFWYLWNTVMHACDCMVHVCSFIPSLLHMQSRICNIIQMIYI